MMDGPQYPSVQGQDVPDLGLAQYGVATDKTAIYPNSDSTGPVKTELPPLDDGDPYGSLNQMGIDPKIPYFDLELANETPLTSPAQLAAPQGIGKVTAPTFYAPDTSVPNLMMGDLTGPGIDNPDPLGIDPYAGDLLDFDKPGGLSIMAATRDPVTIEPTNPDLSAYDRPDGLGMPGPVMVDPDLPDLQSPQLTQDIHMTDRPGDLAADALGAMHSDPSYGLLPTKNPSQLYMEMGGDNQRRERHLGTMYLGLDREERGS